MNRPLRIFLDANILFSAAKSDGAIRSLVTLLLEAGHDLRADGYVVEEARRNLLAKQPQALKEFDGLLKRLSVSTTVVPIDPVSRSVLPEKDQWVLAAAAALGCDALVTGDRTHFGKFFGRRIAGVRIHSPRSLYEHLFRKA
jgi:predicted nucleic acid-binding protein